MSQLTVQIFSSDILESFEHYRKALNATQISLARGSKDEPIHLVMEIMGNNIAIAPLAPHEITKGNVTVLCLKFKDKDSLIKAFEILKEDGQTNGLMELPWSPLEGYVTDKYGVVWCIGI